MKDIAHHVVDQRNQGRMNSYIGKEKQLNMMKERNMLEYGRPEGPTAEQLFVKKGSWEEVIFGTVKSNGAMDVLTGLYK